MSTYLWLRFGDAGTYLRFDRIEEVDLELQFESDACFAGWVDAGFQVSPLYLGQNYVSCYWGDSKGNLSRSLSPAEKGQVEKLITKV